MGLLAHLWLESLHLLCQLGLGVDEVNGGQELIGIQHFLNMWAQLVGEYRQDSDDLPSLCCLQLAHFVVGFHHFRRFDEHRLAGSRLVVYDTFDASFQSWCHGNDQSSVTQRGSYVLRYQSFALCTM